MPAPRIQAYRQAPVNHGDATGGRTPEHQGAAWLVAPPRRSLLWCRPTRAARVPQQVFGTPWRPGGRVVARSGGDHKGLCAIPSGSRHLRRAVQDLAQEVPDAAEVTALVRTVAPPLALAMGRRAQPISDAECSRQAVALNAPIMASMDAPSPHLGSRRIPPSFRAHADRLDLWADDRRVPAEHHVAERDLRPTVLARQVSVGSQSDAGAHPRGPLMSGLHTRKKRGGDVVAHLTGGLARRADAIQQDPWPLLFPEGPT
jgi:transposase